MSEFFSHWQRTRKRGKITFILSRGILLWGLISAFLFCIVMSVFFRQFGSLMHIALAAAAFIVIGSLAAAILWNRNEKKWIYWRSLAKRTKSSVAEEASSPH